MLSFTLQTKLPHTLQTKKNRKKYAHYKRKKYTLQTKLQHAANKKDNVKKLHTANKRITRCKLQTKAKVLHAQDNVSKGLGPCFVVLVVHN